ncbi:DEAD/DEAH box helicase family protein [Moritella yayanosii]|uniref:Helicase/UvrB N-terminal domain-containing protein n=1 Tax=Moritella yayanosii TaxID=69539 RepID=A0A330LSW9_9GAMM|nr:hypothetical protein [Moritella yayanosii]SQD77205.1 protein of unknown function, might belong to DNA helicase [Moritella yayanosii]
MNTKGQPLNQIEFFGILRPEQQNAVDVMAAHDTGILHAPTAFGKTVAAIGLIAKRRSHCVGNVVSANTLGHKKADPSSK